jgi:riboflavin synthase
VNKVSDALSGRALFEINIIPHTHQVTTIRLLRKGTNVNLEIDQLARYVERMLHAQEPAQGT